MKRPTSKASLRVAAEDDALDLAAAMAKVNRGVTEQHGRKPARPKAATRADKKGLVLYIDPVVNKALRQLALDQDQSIQRLGLEALRLLLERHQIEMPPELLPARLLPVLPPTRRSDGADRRPAPR